LQREAAAFANPEGRPPFAVVLMDDGAPDTDRAAIAALPFPVTVAVDPLAEGAAGHAAAYRAGGKEVVMLLTALPAGATPADVEQNLAVYADLLPQAVAAMDGPAGDLQNDRPAASQLVTVLAAQGRGLVTWDRGLNAADQVARREGLATATVFRAIDADDERAEVIRRYLDRAAFRAVQEGEVIVVGRTRPETVAALIAWSLEGRSRDVAIAPVSALLAD
jgi:hypothetical protein